MSFPGVWRRLFIFAFIHSPSNSTSVSVQNAFPKIARFHISDWKLLFKLNQFVIGFAHACVYMHSTIFKNGYYSFFSKYANMSYFSPTGSLTSTHVGCLFQSVTYLTKLLLCYLIATNWTLNTHVSAQFSGQNSTCAWSGFWTNVRTTPFKKLTLHIQNTQLRLLTDCCSPQMQLSQFLLKRKRNLHSESTHTS